GETPDQPGCPTAPLVGTGPDFNHDGDSKDEIVHLWRGGTVQSLDLAATAVAVSQSYVAAIAGEPGSDSGTLSVHPISSGAWTAVGASADSVQIEDAIVAFLTPESTAGISLNGDADTNDRVLQIYDADAGTLTNSGQAGEEFVMGGYAEHELVAF